MHTDVRAVKLDDSSVLEFLILAEQLEAWKAEDDVAAAEERRRARRAQLNAKPAVSTATVAPAGEAVVQAAVPQTPSRRASRKSVLDPHHPFVLSLQHFFDNQLRVRCVLTWTTLVLHRLYR